jgi:hypothetical protein
MVRVGASVAPASVEEMVTAPLSATVPLAVMPLSFSRTPSTVTPVLLVFSATVSVEIPAAKGMRCVVVVWPSREMDSVSAVSMSSAVSFQSS